MYPGVLPFDRSYLLQLFVSPESGSATSSGGTLTTQSREKGGPLVRTVVQKTNSAVMRLGGRKLTRSVRSLGLSSRRGEPTCCGASLIAPRCRSYRRWRKLEGMLAKRHRSCVAAGRKGCHQDCSRRRCRIGRQRCWNSAASTVARLQIQPRGTS